MKHIITVMTFLFIIGTGYAQKNEKRIAFTKGTLKICTTSNMTISGYDGDEVIIKSLNSNANYAYYNRYGEKLNNIKSSDSLVFRYKTFFNEAENKELEEGLTPLGNKSNNPADNLYLDITEKPGELIIKDYNATSNNTGIINAVHFNNKYEMLIPNSVKLLWNTDGCKKTNSNTFFITSGSNAWELSDFKGEAEISTSYRSINLTDVSGPVIANTIGGNIKVVFDKVSPTNLYSLISNDGYIDMSLPQNANVQLDATGNRILSDIDFKVLNEDLTEFDGKRMRLQLNGGKTNIKLDASSGSIYLRKSK
ncbi:hypothetical protein GCM10011344_36320 [Dokdonia pacifica]|uniref:Adhesin domain-containing protein n=1 Tax=Dokdonia pacifica TaxID=1627892 RepID=A0A239AX26_9FLAO|nr:DUF4097 family beta strand repeat-containing protein [Dokdonia pacifica]GGG32141.1 hypothetical protein GCM10011344_36320 [Dokdonia pacifica]SNR99911.1 hypothetical protein SAMN06265376_105179 [Dokdonia pacifica]